MTSYTQSQINAAKKIAELHGYDPNLVSDELAIKFIDWYHNSKTEYSSVEEATRAGLSGLVTNGPAQQEAFWQDEFPLG